MSIMETLPGIALQFEPDAIEATASRFSGRASVSVSIRPILT
jgi:hypothetical protein